MEKNWVLVYSAGKMYQAELLKKKFDEGHIVCDILNKKGSAIPFGDIEVYVIEDDEEKAKAIVAEFED